MRYFRLFYRFVEFSLGRSMEFRFDFCFRIVMDVIYYVMNILFYQILFLHTGSLAGWDGYQTMIFVAGFCVLDAISMTLFANNLYWFPQFVNRGDLDYYLVRPVSPLFFLSLRDFASNSFINFLLSLGLMAWAIARYPAPFGVGKILLFAAFLLLGTTLHYLVRMSFLIPVFWTHSVRGMDTLYFQASRVLERPDRIFKGWARLIFSWVLPFSVMASYPARLVLEAFNWHVFAHLVLVTLLYSVVVGTLWRMGLRSYSSASS